MKTHLRKGIKCQKEKRREQEEQETAEETKATGGEGAQAPALCQSRCPLQLLETQGWSRKCEEERAVERNHYVLTIIPNPATSWGSGRKVSLGI